MPPNHQVMESKEPADLPQVRGLNAVWDPGPEKGQPWRRWGRRGKPAVGSEQGPRIGCLAVPRVVWRCQIETPGKLVRAALEFSALSATSLHI